MTIYNKDEKTGELYHYGIKGQRWGVRRYQNEDGSYTSEGLRKRKINNTINTIHKNKKFKKIVNDKKLEKSYYDSVISTKSPYSKYEKRVNEIAKNFTGDYADVKVTYVLNGIGKISNPYKKAIEDLITSYYDDKYHYNPD